MKKHLFIFAATALLMASCGSKESKNDESNESSTEYSISAPSEDDDNSESSSADYSSTASSSEDSYSSSSSSDDESSSSTTASSDNENWDSLLKEYEEYANKAIALIKKASKGDVSAIKDYAQYVDEAQSLASRLQSAKANLTAAQLSKLANIEKKLTSALSSSKIDTSKADEMVEKAASKAKDKVKEAAGKWGFGGDDDDED